MHGVCYLDVLDALVREFLNEASRTEIGEKGSISSGSHGDFPWGLHEHGMAFTQVHTWQTALLQKPNLQKKNHTFSFPNAKSLQQSIRAFLWGHSMASIHGRLLCLRNQTCRLSCFQSLQKKNENLPIRETCLRAFQAEVSFLLEECACGGISGVARHDYPWNSSRACTPGYLHSFPQHCCQITISMLTSYTTVNGAANDAISNPRCSSTSSSFPQILSERLQKVSAQC